MRLSALRERLRHALPTARELEQACRDAFAWMVTAGIVSRGEVVASVAKQRADVLVDFVLESGRRVPIAFPNLWSSYG